MNRSPRFGSDPLEALQSGSANCMIFVRNRFETKENEMKKEPIHDEQTRFTVLLYRKSRGLRLGEIGVFLAGLLGMLPFFE